MNQTKKKIRLDKYDPAIKENKYLLLCEGESAAGGLQAALGRDYYSYFELKGKPMNALEADIKKIKDNEEFKNIVTILNLELNVKKQNITHDMIVCGTDADLDGHSIKALILAFFRTFAPSLIEEEKIGYLRTPLYYAKKNNKVVKFFFTTEELKKWTKDNPKHGLHFIYVKGLGTWEPEDLESLFKEYGIEYFIKKFTFDSESFIILDNWMSKKTVDFRKEILKDKKFNIEGI